MSEVAGLDFGGGGRGGVGQFVSDPLRMISQRARSLEVDVMEPLPLSRRHPLHGRNLRHAALVVLHRQGAATIGEILEVLWANDFRLTGDRVEAGKRLSDALRHEVRRGRARRVGWGRYALGRVARSTRYRILRRWRLAGPARRDHDGEPVLDGR